jgi:hypothetical protein
LLRVLDRTYIGPALRVTSLFKVSLDGRGSRAIDDVYEIVIKNFYPLFKYIYIYILSNTIALFLVPPRERGDTPFPIALNE